MIKRTWDEWCALAREKYGEDPRDWVFRCVRCGETQTIRDFEAAGLDRESAGRRAAYACIGRLVLDRGCDWSLGGLFQIHTREVERDGETIPVFEFAYESREAGGE